MNTSLWGCCDAFIWSNLEDNPICNWDYLCQGARRTVSTGKWLPHNTCWYHNAMGTQQWRWRYLLCVWTTKRLNRFPWEIKGSFLIFLAIFNERYYLRNFKCQRTIAINSPLLPFWQNQDYFILAQQEMMSLCRNFANQILSCHDQ